MSPPSDASSDLRGAYPNCPVTQEDLRKVFEIPDWLEVYSAILILLLFRYVVTSSSLGEHKRGGEAIFLWVGHLERAFSRLTSSFPAVSPPSLVLRILAYLALRYNKLTRPAK